MSMAQRCFDWAWKGLKAQGFMMAAGWGHACPNRGEFGSCALQHIDDGYRQSASGRGWRYEFPSGWKEGERFAQNIFGAYMDSKSPQEMELRLREFAAERGLVVPADERPAFKKFMEKALECVPLEGIPHW